MKRRYTAVLTPDRVEGGFTVAIPAFPGCFTQGDTRDEALANAAEAMTAWIEDALAYAESLPDDVTPELVMLTVEAQPS